MRDVSKDELFRLFYRWKAHTLPRLEWTHAAHLGAAVCLLQESTLDEAEGTMPALIRGYNESTGTPNSDTEGYHHTITLASLRAVDQVRRSAPGADAAAVLRLLLNSRYGDPRWMAVHWSKALLFSPIARHTWVEPDLLRLPF